jgi:hypothetical protein
MTMWSEWRPYRVLGRCACNIAVWERRCGIGVRSKRAERPTPGLGAVRVRSMAEQSVRGFACFEFGAWSSKVRRRRPTLSTTSETWDARNGVGNKGWESEGSR